MKLVQVSVLRIKDGKILENTILNTNGTLQTKCTNKFNSFGYVIEKTIYTSRNTIDTKLKYFYNNGAVTLIERYNKRNELYSSTKYEFDSTLYLKKSYEIINDTIIDDVFLTQYNEKFLPLKIYSVNEDVEQTLIFKYVYDENNRLDSIYQLNYYDKDIKSKLFYDSLGRIIKRTIYNYYSNELIGEEIIKYDEYSNVIYSKTYDLYDQHWNTTNIEYQYDKNGNWIIKEEWIWIGNRKNIIERTIREIKYE